MSFFSPALTFFKKSSIDWTLFCATLPPIIFGLATMYSFVGEGHFFEKQIISIFISICVFFVISGLDLGLLKRTNVAISLYALSSVLLILLFVVGSVAGGAQSWFHFGFFAFQPADLVKLSLIIVLAKYFSRRHIAIRNIKHIFVSGVYALILFLLVLVQPDFGSSLIIFSIWFGMVFVSGISKKHLFLIVLGGITAFTFLWIFVFAPYQKNRVMTFLNPFADVRGSGWNAFQSLVAVGSGGVMGKGLGFGTQSRLQFLPEYQTDFIFAAFAEEWGFVGTMILFVSYGFLFWRILAFSLGAPNNFEALFGAGLLFFFIAHFTIHVGMNMGLLPVTGLPLPFMSYGGSHLLAEFVGLGILMSFRRRRLGMNPALLQNEFSGFGDRGI